MLMGRFGGESEGLYLGRRSAVVMSVLDEIFLYVGRVEAFAVSRRF